MYKKLQAQVRPWILQAMILSVLEVASLETSEMML